jgi:hypothetical protein
MSPMSLVLAEAPCSPTFLTLKTVTEPSRFEVTDRDGDAGATTCEAESSTP